MKIVLLIKINTPSNKDGLDFYKVYNSSIIPSVATFIKDPIFEELKLIKSVVVNYFEDTCIVELEEKEVPDGRLDGHIQEVAGMHNWKQKNNSLIYY
ncbi:MAG: hypothetical protein KAU02_01430 [Tenericutes bacterium]|nr:hypothetical protein [Mycoplasmatota bacterium]